jgi:HEAT repeat protein
VRHQAPLILQRIGFRSREVLPALLKTMTDDRYASVRSNSVIALGSLAGDLKADDPDLATIVTALATALTADPSENIRSYAANYLGYLGPQGAAAIPALKQATDDKKEYVRKSAEEALQKVEGTKPLERDPFGGKKR